MKKILLRTICMAMALIFLSSACACTGNIPAPDDQQEPPSAEVVSDSELEEDRTHASFEMTETESEIAAHNVELDLSEDSPMNTYGFPVSEHPYFIYVEKGSHSITIYTKDAFGFYTVEVGCWLTGTGSTASLTPTGIFSISKKEKWHNWPSGNVSPYATKYYENAHYGGLFIHAAIYGRKNFSNPFPNSLRGIGKNSTSGCLRTSVQCAYFVYNYCESGTLMKIVNGAPLKKKPPALVFSTQYTDPAVSGVNVAIPEPVLLTDIDFDKERYTIPAGTDSTIMPNFYPENSAYTACTWTSSDESIATVENGVVHGIKPGTVRITATYTLDGSISASCIVKVQVGQVVEEPAAEPVELPEPYSPAESNPLPFESKLIALDFSGFKATINAPAQPLIDILGDDFSYEEAESCAYNGLDKKYSYTDDTGVVELSTIPLLEGKDTICEVYVTRPGVSTTRGICVGDDVHDIEAAYGTDFTCETVSDYGREDCYMILTYWAGEKNAPTTPQLTFTLDPDTLTVTSICIYSARNFG